MVEGLDPDDRESIHSIRRCLNEDKNLSSRVEFVFDSVVIPRNITIEGFSIPITPVIPKPSRCFRCQRYCHVMAQCRSSRPYCEYCSEGHSTNFCPNMNRVRKCKNCKGKHIASSMECTIYIGLYWISISILRILIGMIQFPSFKESPQHYLDLIQLIPTLLVESKFQLVMTKMLVFLVKIKIPRNDG